jgi:hypothetical protein
VNFDAAKSRRFHPRQRAVFLTLSRPQCGFTDP